MGPGLKILILRIAGPGSRVPGSRFLGLSSQGLRSRAPGSRVSGPGFRVPGFRSHGPGSQFQGSRVPSPDFRLSLKLIVLASTKFRYGYKMSTSNIYSCFLILMYIRLNENVHKYSYDVLDVI